MTTTAPRTKGAGWDVFYVGGPVPEHGTHEIQRIDFPGGDSAPGLAPAFDSDDEAVRFLIALARNGDAEAIEALRQCHDDPLVIAIRNEENA